VGVCLVGGVVILINFHGHFCHRDSYMVKIAMHLAIHAIHHAARMLVSYPAVYGAPCENLLGIF
jgi:hypothetical protein